MALCLLALPIFAILGIFSLKYRKLARDALDCLFKTATLRKCDSQLDDRIKSYISGKLLKFSPACAKFTYRYYKPISVIVMILFIWSAYASAVGINNYVKYGNCNGPEETGFCVFDPTGQYSGTSDIDTLAPSEIIYPELEEDDPIIGPPDAELTIIEFGCYGCPYTKKAEPVVQEVIDYYEGRVNFQFKVFIIPRHKTAKPAAFAASCAQEQGKYKVYHDALFAQQETLGDGVYVAIATQLGLDVEQFEKCFTEQTYNEEIEADINAGFNAGVVGTPTFFINEQKIVGPKPFKTFKSLINEALE